MKLKTAGIFAACLVSVFIGISIGVWTADRMNTARLNPPPPDSYRVVDKTKILTLDGKKYFSQSPENYRKWRRANARPLSLYYGTDLTEAYSLLSWKRHIENLESK